MSAAVDKEMTLWDVVEEHLNESAFLFERWQQAIIAPHYTLNEVGERLERRLEAHLDGLLVGGAPVAERLLHPLLRESQDPLMATAATLVLLRSERSADRYEPIRALRETSEAQQLALARALQLSEVSFIDQALEVALKDNSDPDSRAVVLDVMAARGLDPGTLLLESLSIEHVSLQRAALKVAGRAHRRDLVDHAERHLFSDDQKLRNAALETGLCLGSSQSWRECLALAQERTPRANALLLVALLGGRKEHQLIHGALRYDSSREAALWAIGFTGSVESANLCLPFVASDEPRISKLAAEAMGAIAGFDLFSGELKAPPQDDKDGLVPLSEDNLDADLVPDSVDALPLPDAQAVALQWTKWTHNLQTLKNDQRTIYGQPWSPQSLLQALRTAPMRRRHAHGIELRIRTGAARQVTTDAFTSLQRQQLHALEGLDRRDLNNDPCGRW